ncbi:MAG: hypothetical protein WD492_17105 [Alkalispirochaeta sp.]
MIATIPHRKRRSRALVLLTLLLILSLTGCVSLIGGTAAEPEPSRNRQDPAREYLFETPEHTVMDTPWFTVSSVVLRVQRTQPETVIVVPPDSDMRRYLALSQYARTPTTTIPGNRFLFNLGVLTDGVPPFASDPDRYRYPDLYE